MSENGCEGFKSYASSENVRKGPKSDGIVNDIDGKKLQIKRLSNNR